MELETLEDMTEAEGVKSQDTEDQPSFTDIDESSPYYIEVEGAKTALLHLQEFAGMPNIAAIAEEDTLKRIGEAVKTNYEADEVDRQDRVDQMDMSMSLALQKREPKNTPWPNAANVKFPLLTKAAVDFAARAYPEIVKGQSIVKGIVVGSDEGVPQIDPNTGQFIPEVDASGQPVVGENGQPKAKLINAGEKRKRANRVANYLNYQLTEEIECWEKNTDTLLFALAICGSMYRKKFYNPLKGHLDSYIIYPKQMVLPYYAESIKTTPRATELIELYPNEIEERERAGIFLELDYTHSQETLERTGETYKDPDPNTNDDDTPHVFLEQHTLFDLDGDGYAEPYIVTVRKETGEVVRIKARYQDFITGDITTEQIKLGVGEVLVDSISGAIVRINPECYYIDYEFIPSPDGSAYGMGFGDLLMPVNETINTLINQLLDAGTLSNMSTGFIGTGLRMKAGRIRQAPGLWTRVESPGGAIKDNMVQINHPEPSRTLFQLLGVLLEQGKELGVIKDVLTGEAAVNQAATTTMALIEQGLKAFQSIFKRIHRSIKGELRRMYWLNSQYLPQDAYYSIMGNSGAVVREDFDPRSVDVIPASDPNIMTDVQRMAQAQFLMENRGDPNINGVETLRRVYEYMKIEDIDDLVVDAPPQPSPQMIAAMTEQIRKEVEDKTKQEQIKLEDARKRKEIEIDAEIEAEKLLMNEKLTMSKIAADIIKNMTNNKTIADDEEGRRKQQEMMAMVLENLNKSRDDIAEAVVKMTAPRKSRFIKGPNGEIEGSESYVE